MVRQIKSDTPTRAVIEYDEIWADGRVEKHTHVVGPYDQKHHCKMMVLRTISDWPTDRAAWTKITEIRYERVKEWETTGYELQVP